MFLLNIYKFISNTKRGVLQYIYNLISHTHNYSRTHSNSSPSSLTAYISSTYRQGVCRLRIFQIIYFIYTIDFVNCLFPFQDNTRYKNFMEASSIFQFYRWRVLEFYSGLGPSTMVLISTLLFVIFIWYLHLRYSNTPN